MDIPPLSKEISFLEMLEMAYTPCHIFFLKHFPISFALCLRWWFSAMFHLCPSLFCTRTGFDIIMFCCQELKCDTTSSYNLRQLLVYFLRMSTPKPSTLNGEILSGLAGDICVTA
jgi:hypothetical protein